MDDDLMDMIIGDKSPSDISNKIKDILFAKSAEKINDTKPTVAADMFAGVTGGSEESVEDSE
tara:strand:+ start:344 stop:529 length:186 start_codon:yes stop_codon:yes gene_type:complete